MRGLPVLVITTVNSQGLQFVTLFHHVISIHPIEDSCVFSTRNIIDHIVAEGIPPLI